MRVHHRKITTLRPKANAETERFMRTIKKVIRDKPNNWKQMMYKLLLDYRATPHSTTGIAPATLMFGRDIGTKLPSVPSKSTNDLDLHYKDNEAKRNMKLYADSKRNVKPCEITVGDNVLVKNTSVKKVTPYDSRPLTVVERKGSMITAG